MQDRLVSLLEQEPVVVLAGPRACGKTFTCERVIAALGGTVLRLDDPAERRAAAADPTGYVRGRIHPVLIDEYQHVPELVAAIKADLSRHGAEPGRFLLTGSVRAELAGVEERLTGRIHRARLHPLSQGEHRRQPPEAFLAAVLQDPATVATRRPSEAMGTLEYLEVVCRGGFPLAADRDPAARQRWYRDYVDDTVLRDALTFANIRKPGEMRRLLSLLAAFTARVVPAGALAADLQLERHAVAAYREVLASLFLVDELPPWRTNRSQRVIKSPKLHLSDTGLAVALLGLDVDALRADHALAGHLLETFVVGELRKQASWLDSPPTFLHFSESERAEVDVVLERPDGALVGVEVTLADHVDDRDLRGLRRLRDLAGDRWLGGMALAAVPAGYRTDDGLVVAPVAAVWEG